MKVVLDTCALLRWTHDETALSERLREHLRSAPTGDTLLPAISLWEIALKVARRRLDLGMAPRHYIQRVKLLPLQVVPTIADVWVESALLDWSHRDPVDRIMVVTARQQGAHLATCDTQIRTFLADTIW